MPGPPEEIPSGALSDVAFLARSENRLRVLTAVAAAPATRRELEDATGVARATVGRALAAFEERGWVVESRDRTYEATPSGAHIAASFRPFLDTIAAIRRLGDRVAWLPVDVAPIELQHLSDASIRRPEPADPLSPAMSLTELLQDAAEFHCVVGVAPPLGFERVMRDRVVAGELTTRHVITAEELSYLREDADRIARWREYVEAGGNLFRFDGEIPCNLLLFDDTVIVGPYPRDGEPAGLIESENEVVCEWAHEIIGIYEREADRLDPGALEP